MDDVVKRGIARFCHFQDMTWPTPGDDPAGDIASLEWLLRYAPERLTRGDQLHLASIVSAYRELLNCPERKRRVVVRNIRHILKRRAVSASEKQ